MKNKLSTLTSRQYEILELYVWTKSRKNVAVILDISVRTVDNTLLKICEMLECGATDLPAIYMEETLHATRPSKLITPAELARRLRNRLGAMVVVIGLGAQIAVDLTLTHQTNATLSSRTASRSSGRSSGRPSRKNKNELGFATW